MKIVVVGAGALGAYFGGRLLEAGADVTFLVREGRAEQIRTNGLRINSTKGDYKIDSPNIVTNAVEIADADLVIISLKGYHLQEAFNSLKVLVKKGAYLLPVLNGVEHINQLQDKFGKAVVIGGLCFIMATLDKKGYVEHTSKFHKLVYGKLDESQTEICNKLEMLANKANIEVNHSSDITRELWKKYMYISAFSGITTATNLPIGPIRSQEETRSIANKLLIEMQMLASRYNVQLTDTDIAGVMKSFSELSPDATSSMHQDRRKGLTLEVDHLQGGAIRLAGAVGLDLPYTKAIHGIIKPFEFGHR